MLLLQAHADVPTEGGFGAANPVGPLDIVFPSWTVPLYRADGRVREVEITRHTDVLGYPVLEDTRLVSVFSDLQVILALTCIDSSVGDIFQAIHTYLNYMIQLCVNMKTMITDLSQDRFSRPLGSSNRGAQVDPAGVNPEDDDADALAA